MSYAQQLWKAACIAAVAGLLLGVLPMQARETCAQRIRQAQARLNQAVRKRGRNSRQAEHRRRQLDRVRDQCGRDRRL